MTWELTLTGLAIGALVGVTGMGGGSLMTPVLVLVFGFNVLVAVGTDILHGAIFKTIGAWRHRALGHVHARMTFWLAAGSVPASIGGVYVVELLQRSYGEDVNDVASVILGGALVLGGTGILLRTLVRPKPTDNRPYILRNRDRILAVLVGLVGGFILGLTSVGSGTFFGLMLIVLFPLTAAKIVGTDIFHAAVLLWAAGLTHLWAENVDLGATAWLAAGSIPGVVLGSHWTARLPERAIRIALAVVLLLAGVKLAGVIPGF
ncbi:MAG: sulfite exporter TauE/SafE family protein [Actinomycetota bacterium]|nr:sulfite exporter TauE/SafE family protein [Actinomycetota bacterium]